MGPAPKTCCVETMLRSVLFTTISPSAEQRTVDPMVPRSTHTTGAGNMGMSPSNFLLIQFPVCVPLSAHYSATLPHWATLGHQQPRDKTVSIHCIIFICREALKNILIPTNVSRLYSIIFYYYIL